jgi:pimeloyl-ACP methyl ester carboxylesterase
MHSVILLPGLACDGELFDGLLQAQPGLAQEHRVQVSDVHTRCASLPEMAAMLLAEQPGVHVLVGVSMGGMLALELLRQAPQRVRAVALFGTTARADTPELITLRSQACELFAAGRMDEVLRANVLFAFHPHNASQADLVAAYLAMIRRAGAQQLIQQNRAVMARINSLPHLAHISCPALVMCGEADALTPPEQAQEMADAMVNAKLHTQAGANVHTVAGAGHMLTLERPAGVAAHLMDWLNSLPTA